MGSSFGRRIALVLCGVLALSAACLQAVTQAAPEKLGPPAAFSLTAAGGSGGPSPSGTASSTASMTNTFSPSAYVDYKRFGGEPSDVVDRYPFPGLSTAPAAQCAPGTTSCFKDLVYASAPEGLPGVSYFWKSDDLGQTFRLPAHLPSTGISPGQGPGGGDSHQTVGERTHNVFFVDLPGDCVTFNRSTDLGESFTTDPLGCGLEPGAIDDRQWVDADESRPDGRKNVYISFIDFTTEFTPTLALARSQQDGAQGSFATDSVCNTLTQADGTKNVPGSPAPDAQPTACPDPLDGQLSIAGPVLADRNVTHNVYIPFVRATSSSGSGPDYSLWVAKSSDGASTWTRRKVAELGQHNPQNIFPQMAVDRAGNLYYTWSQTQDPSNPDGVGGETDVYYTYSTTQGETWAPPIDLTRERGDSAVFPWMVAGDRGRVDLVFYRANTGLNPNVAFVDDNGNACEEGPGCERENPSVWNVYFSQSLNALNPGPNFRAVQISDHPNHLGSICTNGLACENSGGNRRLLDFFTVDIDHLGAANVVWADDNNGRGDTRNKFSRQLAGSSVFAGQQIALQNDWPVRDHSTTDRAGDVFDAKGTAEGSCLGMDVLGTSAVRSGNLLTVSITLNAPPTAAEAIACSGAPGAFATGGLWGAEFWASSQPDPTTGRGPNDNFYIAFVDNPGDVARPFPHVEAGRVNSVNATVTSAEFHRTQDGTPGGTCRNHPAPTPCTITMTTTLDTLGIKPGAGLYSITGLSTYFFASEQRPPFFRIAAGNSEQADAATAFNLTGTGNTP